MMFHISPRTSEGLPSAISAASMLTSLTWKEAVMSAKLGSEKSDCHHPCPQNADAADCLVLSVVAKGHLLGTPGVENYT